MKSDSVVKKLTWEYPLGTIRGQLEEPGPRFIDPYDKEEREAIQADPQTPAQIRKVRVAG